MSYSPDADVDIKIGGMSFRVRNVVAIPNRFSQYAPNMAHVEMFNVTVHLLMEGDTVYAWEENVYLYDTSEFSSDSDYEHAIRLEVRAMIGHRIEKLIGTVLKLQRLND